MFIVSNNLGDKTHNLIGISETLIATCISGTLFALLSGQPLVIVGTTGPLLLFDESLFSVSIIKSKKSEVCKK